MKGTSPARASSGLSTSDHGCREDASERYLLAAPLATHCRDALRGLAHAYAVPLPGQLLCSFRFPLGSCPGCKGPPSAPGPPAWSLRGWQVCWPCCDRLGRLQLFVFFFGAGSCLAAAGLALALTAGACRRCGRRRHVLRKEQVLVGCEQAPVADKALWDAQDLRCKGLVEAECRVERAGREHALVERTPQPAVLAYVPCKDMPTWFSASQCPGILQFSCKGQPAPH